MNENEYKFLIKQEKKIGKTAIVLFLKTVKNWGKSRTAITKMMTMK